MATTEQWKAINDGTKTLLEAYSTNRYYHTIAHINYMLKHMYGFELNGRDFSKMIMAILYHDIVYDAASNKNEYNSAEFFANHNKNLSAFNEDEVEEIKSLILIKSHKETPKTKLEKIICDLDLRELSSDRQSEITEQVRKEYSHLSDKEFYKGRLEFFKNMLNKKFIYHTDLYRSSLEDQARHKITKEIESINQILNANS